jgi:hypothetical protein
MTEPGSGWSSPGGFTSPAPSSEPANAPAPSGYGVSRAAPPATWSSAPGVVPLRPLGIGELLDGSIKIMRRNPVSAYGPSAAIAAVVTIINVAIILAFVQVSEIDEQSGSLGDLLSQGASDVAANLPNYVLLTFGGLLLLTVLVNVVSRALLGQTSELAEVTSELRPRLRRLLGMVVVTTLLAWSPLLVTFLLVLVAGSAAGLLLILTVPAFFYLWVRMSLVPSVYVLEKDTVRAALTRSGKLLEGSFWRCLGIMVLGFLISLVLRSILAVPLALVLAIVSGGQLSLLELVAVQVMAGLAQVIVAPFTAGVKALMYIDQRMRLEGLDVALQSARATRVPTTVR